MAGTRLGRALGMIVVLAVEWAPTGAWAGDITTDPLQERRAVLRTPARSIEARIHPVDRIGAPGYGDPRGSCPQVVTTHTDSDFGPGTYVVQAGFEEGEIQAASYELSPDMFPLRIDMVETLFATVNAIQETETHWSILIWEGTPTSGSLVLEMSSDGVILPHLVMPPGTTGAIIQIVGAKNDPKNEIWVYDDGSHTFTVGFRIDQHNAPGVPCVSSPPSNQNAFPTTDTSGVASMTGNWIFAVDGTLCVCGSGWFTFQSFPGFCTPTGDWVMRASWTPLSCTGQEGACCLDDATCFEVTTGDCDALGGTFEGAGTACASTNCPLPTGACCIPATGACVDFEQADCAAVGGQWQGESTDCATTTCFPVGACCLPDGTCLDDQAPEDCEAAGGVFQGDQVTCASIECPAQEGACCVNDACLDLDEETCAAVGGAWSGPGSDCTAPDACTACPADVDRDGTVAVGDVLAVLGAWGEAGGPADVDGDGAVAVGDLLAVIAAWGPCG